jgi:hypothetical protein
MHRLERGELSAKGDSHMSLPANFDYYSAFEAELQEILRHKYLASEKAGHDIGFEQALREWVAHHRKAWREGKGLSGKGEK